MEKVKLPREVAKALDFYSVKNVINDSKERLFLQVFYMKNDEPNTHEIIALHHYFTDHGWLKLAEALVNGYEVEETPEEKVSGLFNNPGPFHNGIGELSVAYRDGIRDTLNTLGIKIEGVNA